MFQLRKLKEVKKNNERNNIFNNVGIIYILSIFGILLKANRYFLFYFLKIIIGGTRHNSFSNHDSKDV